MDLVEIVASDLRHIEAKWGDAIDDQTLRRESPILRRLLVEGDLQQAWKRIGFNGQPRIIASSLSKAVATIPNKRIKFASAGGANYGGVEVRGTVMVDYAMKEDELQRVYALGVPEEEFGLVNFVKSPCMIIEGRLVSRHNLVKYVNNKLGGAHFDPQRKKVKAIIHLLDTVAEDVEIAGKNSVFWELLSVGQALVGSEDLDEFCRKAGL